MNRSIKHAFGYVCAMSMALAILSSCISSDAPDRSRLAGDDYIVNLSLSTKSLSTRAAGHPTEAGTDAESFIDMKDFSVYVFDGADGSFMQRFDPAAVFLQQNDNDSDGLVRYRISGAFQPVKRLESVRFMVLANWQTAFGRRYYEAEQQMQSSTLTAIYGDDANFNFTLPADDSKSWLPGEDGSGGIPMFGLSDVVSLDDDPMIKVTNAIPMLRSLAKIEIVDKVPGTDGAKIQKCVLTGYNQNGRFIPAVDGEWSTWANAVPALSLPDSPSPAKNLLFAKTSKTVELADGTSELRDCFVAYVPEMQFTDDIRPVVEVYINGAAYTVELSKYENGKPKAGGGCDDLRRNHSYRFNIVGVGVEAELHLLIETPYWDLDEDEYYYDDAAAEYAVGGAFSWAWSEEIRDSEENILNEQDADRRNVVVSQADPEDDERGAIATFAFAEPARGSWTLSISADDGTPKHWFRIQLWDAVAQRWVEEDQMPDTENVIASAVSGKIAPKGGTPESVKVRIVAQGMNTSGNPYTARLVMSVGTFDGRMVEANLTASDPMEPIGDNGHYIIKQYPISEL